MRLPGGNIVVVCLLILSACAPVAGGAAQRVAAPPPPASYIYLGSGDARDANKIVAKINFEYMEQGEPDERLALLFGLLFAGAARTAVAAGPEVSGTGLSADDPIGFPAVAADAELVAAVNYLAGQFPDRANVVGDLFRAPDHRYVVRVSFDTGAGANALYVDVTRWAQTKIVAYRN